MKAISLAELKTLKEVHWVEVMQMSLEEITMSLSCNENIIKNLRQSQKRGVRNFDAKIRALEVINQNYEARFNQLTR